MELIARVIVNCDPELTYVLLGPPLTLVFLKLTNAHRWTKSMSVSAITSVILASPGLPTYYHKFFRFYFLV